MSRLTKNEISRIKNLYTRRHSVREISERTGRSDITVRKYLKAAGIYVGPLPTQEELARFEILYMNGNDYSAIARITKRSTRTVKKYLKASSRIRLRSYYFSDEDLALASEMYDAGYGLGPISRRLNFSRDTIRRHLIAAGVEMRASGGGHPAHFRLPHAAIDLTVGLYRQGRPLEEIAQIMGIQKSTVRERLIRVGEPRRSRREAQLLSWKQSDSSRRERTRQSALRMRKDEKGHWLPASDQLAA